MKKIKTEDIKIPFEVIFTYVVESDKIILGLLTSLHHGNLSLDLKVKYLKRVKALLANIEDADQNYDCEKDRSYMRFCMIFRTKELLSINQSNFQPN